MACLWKLLIWYTGQPKEGGPLPLLFMLPHYCLPSQMAGTLFKASMAAFRLQIQEAWRSSTYALHAVSEGHVEVCGHAAHDRLAVSADAAGQHSDLGRVEKLHRLPNERPEELRSASKAQHLTLLLPARLVHLTCTVASLQ